MRKSEKACKSARKVSPDFNSGDKKQHPMVFTESILEQMYFAFLKMGQKLQFSTLDFACQALFLLFPCAPIFKALWH